MASEDRCRKIILCARALKERKKENGYVGNTSHGREYMKITTKEVPKMQILFVKFVIKCVSERVRST